MAKEKILPLFIPHLGCPHVCVFCDQNAIAGKEFDFEQIRRDLEIFFADQQNIGAQIAFFGGSFTAIDKDLMRRFLSLGYGYVQAGKASGIRISTRPDVVNNETLDCLKAYGVKTIELGIQSMSEEVLMKSGRGHNPWQSLDAMQRIREKGFVLGGQMMVGLPASTPEREKETALAICQGGAKECRIYPTVVLRNTALAAMNRRGEYTPLTVEEAVWRCVPLRELFAQHHVTVLRMGLCENEELRRNDAMVAGPYHPAFGELVEQACMKQKIEAFLLGKETRGKRLEIIVSPRSVSRITGHGGLKKNLLTRYELTDMTLQTDGNMTDGRGVKIVLKDH